MFKFVLLVAAVGTLSACSPQQFETAPAEVMTEAGPVTCQFYSPRIVMWDKPTAYPQGMTMDEAVSVCRQEGMARKRAN